MQALNLDGLVKIEKSVTLKGKEYEIQEMSVEGFLLALKDADKLDPTKPVTLRENIEQTITHIQRVIPDMPKADILSLNLGQLTALVALVNGNVTEQGQNPGAAEAPK